MADSKQIKLLEDWYKLDKNVLPDGVYILQSRRRNLGDGIDYKNSEVYSQTVEKPLLELFQQLTKESGYKDYNISATEQEILKGAFEIDDANEHVVAYFRTITEIPEEKKIEIIDNLPKANNLKNRIKDNIDERNIFEQEIPFRQYTDNSSLNKFEQEIYNRIVFIVDREIRSWEHHDNADDSLVQEEFIKEKSHLFIGREREINQIIENFDKKGVSVVTGSSGSGKSTLMAYAANLTKIKYPQNNVIAYFIGSSIKVSNGNGLLDALWSRLEKLYPQREGYDKLSQSFANIKPRLIKISKELEASILYIFIDALDQLPESDPFLNIKWMHDISHLENVKFIVSILDKKEYSHIINNDLNNIIRVNLMSENDSIELITEILARNNRRITSLQTDAVNSMLSNAELSPMYVTLLGQILCQTHSYDDIQSQGYPKLLIQAKNAQEIIEYNLSRLSEPQKHGELVTKCMVLLRHSRLGLTQTEICRMIALDTSYWDLFLQLTHHEVIISEDIQPSLPLIVWSRLYNDLQHFLKIENTKAGNFITFYHSQITEAIDRMYLADTRLQYYGYELIAKYFLEQGYNNRHGLYELPSALAFSRQPDILEKLLAAPEFIQKKAELFHADLVNDYSTAIQACLVWYNNMPGHEEAINKLKSLRLFVEHECKMAWFEKDYVKAKILTYRKDNVLEDIFPYDEMLPPLNDKICDNTKPFAPFIDKLPFKIGEQPQIIQNGTAIISINPIEERIEIYDLKSHQLINTILQNSKVTTYDVDEEGKMLVVVDQDKVRWYDLLKHRWTSHIDFKKHVDSVNWISVSPDSKRTAIGTNQHVWIREMGKNAVETLFCKGNSLAGQFTTDNNMLWYLIDGEVHRHNFITNKCNKPASIPTEGPDYIKNKEIKFARNLTKYLCALQGMGYITILHYLDKKEEKGLCMTSSKNAVGIPFIYEELIFATTLYNTIIAYKAEGHEIKGIHYHLYSSDVVADTTNGLVYDCQTGDVLDLNLVLGGYYGEFNNGTNQVSSLALSNNNDELIISYGMRPADFSPMLNYVDKDGHTVNILPIKDDSQLSIFTSSAITFDGKVVVAASFSYFTKDRNVQLVFTDLLTGSSLTVKHESIENTVIKIIPVADGGHFLSITGNRIFDLQSSWLLTTIDGRIVKSYKASDDNEIGMYITDAIPFSNGRNFLLCGSGSELFILDIVSEEISEIGNNSIDENNYWDRIITTPDENKIDDSMALSQSMAYPDIANLFYRTFYNCYIKPDSSGIYFSRENKVLYYCMKKRKTFEIGIEGRIMSGSLDGRELYLYRDEKLIEHNLSGIERVIYKGKLNMIFPTVDNKHIFIIDRVKILLLNIETTSFIQQSIINESPQQFSFNGKSLAISNLDGRLYILQPDNQYSVSNNAIVTALNNWDYILGDSLGIIAICPICGFVFKPDKAILSIIKEKTYIDDLKNTDWDNPSLLCNCPTCNSSLKFNPYIA